MSEFNGKKYYGFSLENDPALLSSTRNYEFKYAQADQIERALHKIHNTNNQSKNKKSETLKKVNRQKKSHCNMSQHRSCDADVETQVSSRDAARNMSDIEVNLLIDKAKKAKEFCDFCNCDFENHEEASGSIAANFLNTNLTDIREMQRVQKIDKLFESDFKAIATTASSDQLAIEEYPTPKWVEIETHTEIKIEVNADSQEIAAPVKNMHDNIQQNANDEVNVDFRNDSGIKPTPPNIDSDLSEEMCARVEYMKYCDERPAKETNLLGLMGLDESEGLSANFFEVEPILRTLNVSLVKNDAPMLFSDKTDDDKEADAQEMKVFIKTLKAEFNADEQNCSQIELIEDVIHKFAKHETTVGPTSKVIRKANMKATKPPAQMKRNATSAHRANQKVKNASLNAQPKISKNAQTNQATNKHMPLSAKSHKKCKSPEQKGLSKMLLKSMEKLTSEKKLLFQKMNTTHEQMIKLLDKIRICLLKFYIPHDTKQDKVKNKAKNGLEYSVKFARNYLYPLKGMIEVLTHTTTKQYNSALSNEACARVASVYTLMEHSLNSYLKHKIYIDVDQVTQKLTILIEMIVTTTTMLIEKRVFAINDITVDSLLDRCAKFMDFLEGIHHERYSMAQSQYRKLKLEESAHKKYDLKMCLNNLNMYEPKLVPKKRPQRRRKIAAPVVKMTKGVGKNYGKHRFPHSSEMVLRKNAEDGIATHIQNFENTCSSDLVNHVVSLSREFLPNAHEQNNPFLSKALIAALQTVTKEQIHQVLEPVLDVLITAVEKKDSACTVDKLVDAVKKSWLPKEKPQAIVEGKCYKIQQGQVLSSSDDSCLDQTDRMNSLDETKSNEFLQILPNETDINVAKAESATACSKEIGDKSAETNADYAVDTYDSKSRMLAEKSLDFDDSMMRQKMQECCDTMISKVPADDDETDSDTSSIAETSSTKSLNRFLTEELFINCKKPSLEAACEAEPYLVEHAESSSSLEAFEIRAAAATAAAAANTNESLPKEKERKPLKICMANVNKKNKWIKKRLHPVLPPPPVPVGTPQDSARTPKGSEALSQTSIYEETKSILTADENNAMIRLEGGSDKRLLNNADVAKSRSSSVIYNPYEAAQQLPQQKLLQLGNSSRQRTHPQRLSIKCVIPLEENNSRSVTYEPHSLPYLESPCESSSSSKHSKDDGSKMLYRSFNKKNNIATAAACNNFYDSIEKYENVDLNVKAILDEKKQLKKKCKKNPYYSNTKYKNPWQLFSGIAVNLVSDMTHELEADFNKGVSSFVETFLNLEKFS